MVCKNEKILGKCPLCGRNILYSKPAFIYHERGINNSLYNCLLAQLQINCGNATFEEAKAMFDAGDWHKLRLDGEENGRWRIAEDEDKKYKK